MEAFGVALGQAGPSKDLAVPRKWFMGLVLVPTRVSPRCSIEDDG